MRLQEFIHSIEQGRLAKWVIFVVVVAILALGYAHFVFGTLPQFSRFRGLTNAMGMDQAQIAREIARGNGFSTKDFRPIAITQFKEHKGKFPLDNVPDTYHAPLNPYINSLFLRLSGGSWEMTTKDTIYVYDRIIASVGVLFLVLGIGVTYLTFRRIFDEKISGLAIGLLIINNDYWNLAVSGLPQMLMFFLFSCCAYVLFRAIEAHRQEKPTTALLAAAGFLFGLLALAHALTIWVFVGAVIFSLLYFTPRYQGAAVMIAIFCIVYSPWLLRNYKVCGHAFGIAHLSFIGSLDGSEMSRMRGQDTSLGGLALSAARGQLKDQLLLQSSQFYRLLGQNPMAPVFFVTLLYVFKRPEASAFRWLILTMWIFALLGMSLVGINDANNIYIFFVPVMTLYGFAYIMMLWSRLEINIPLLRYTFIFFIYALSILPMVSQVTSPPPYPVNWPPYVPPSIAQLANWTTENEIIASDMPWAVAWYADRKSLEIPVSISDFLNYYDWSEMSGNLVGLYLTPITGNQPLISSVLKGEDKDWAPFILRGVRSKDFPYHAVVPMAVDSECVFYCESDRWSQKTD